MLSINQLHPTVIPATIQVFSCSYLFENILDTLHCKREMHREWTALVIVCATVVAASLPEVKTDADYDYNKRLISRDQWSIVPDSKAEDLRIKPARYALIAHTVTVFCTERSNCSETVRSFEKWNIELGMNMIGYNFLIGGDGNIYEGRGWGKMGAAARGFNCATVSIAFIGNFEKHTLNQPMIDALTILLAEGVKRGELVSDYKLVGHNQVTRTLSPGAHIREVIEKWSHWAQVTEDDFICS